MDIDFKYYLSAGLRRLPIFVTIFVVVSALSIWLALKLPPTYEAGARLLVEAPEIQLDGVGQPINPAEQLEVLEQRLMTRQNLTEIANAHNVFPEGDAMSADDIIEQMMEMTTIDRAAGRDQATLMTISFSADRPEVVARVANDYVTRIKNLSVSDQIDSAKSKLVFFEKQVENLSAELDRTSQRIAEFKTANTEALPDSLEFNLNRQTSILERLALTRREKSALEDQRRRLVDLFEQTGAVSVSSDRPQLTPNERQLENLRNELSNALAVLSPSNPKVKILQAQVDQLEQQIASLGTVIVPESSSNDPATTILDVQLADVDAKMQFQEEQILAIEEELVSLGESIERTPSNAITLEAMEREYENTQSQYNQAVLQLANAKTDVLVETQAKGRRMTVIEPASVPTEPSSPNRPVVAGGGIVSGFILGTALVVLLELMNKAIRRPADLTKAIGISPIVTVPYIRTRREIFMTRLKAIVIPLVVIGIAAVGLFAVDQFVMPIDLVLERITDRFAF